MMVPAGKITENTFQELLKLAEPGDTIVDGGNSNFRDSQRRYEEAREQGITSSTPASRAAIWGLEVGFCLMVGGDEARSQRLEPIFTPRARGRLRARRRRRARATSRRWSTTGSSTG